MRDVSLFLRHKKRLKRELLDSIKNALPKKVALLGGSSTAEIKDLLEVCLLKAGIAPSFYESDYNRYYEESAFENPALRDFAPDLIYLHTSSLNIERFPALNTPKEEIAKLIQQEMNKLEIMLISLKTRYSCAIIINNFDLLSHRSLGNLDALSGKTHFIHTLNVALVNLVKEHPSVYVQDLLYLSAQVGLSKWFDPNLYYRAKYAMSYEGLAHVALNLGKIICAIFGLSKKVLILDMDNTLYGGVIADDGLAGLVIGSESALAESYTAFQRYILELKNRGVLLAICSKNTHENALLALSHENMLLKPSDFACIKANFEPKDRNILEIAKELNLGLDSFVFMDDNPAERALVAAQLPSVAVPDIGQPEDYITRLDEAGYFEPISLSKEDLARAAQYQANAQRQSAQQQFSSYAEFLQSLEMRAVIAPFHANIFERLTQLINKTNQFNCTTKRCTLAQVQEWAQNPTYITLYGQLVDKFGDNGIVAISVGRVEGETCHLEIWLMSCRVLKRDLEFAMLNSLVKRARELGVKTLKGYYYPTPKNAMVADLYTSFGFTLKSQAEDGSVFGLDLDQHTDKLHYIKVSNGTSTDF
ncbi:HAD-IIIC family phosphatase [Helicobacter cynogastricus]|uniref:HAD-IIIC family phosphatase n=1 Tax=Helicobacter cynogastricus TaxID=329937 RepID=UPI001F45A89E|nr:HAD-IIIC family phosphatase [Helicobacter cynogastricus]